MNRTRIDWSDYTWNPVVGCRHACPYCYGRRVAERGLGEYGKWPKGERFQPRLLEDRLDDPKKLLTPATIFVGSMCDLFGSWVPLDWIRQVLDVVEACPWHTFIFLTKNPLRYLQMAYLGLGFPQNAWVGYTLTDVQGLRSVNLGVPVQGGKSLLAGKRFISFEPLGQKGGPQITMPLVARNYRITEDGPDFRLDFQGIDWIIIGGLSGKGEQPKRELVEFLVERAHAQGIPVFMKRNLEPTWGPDLVQEWPA